MLDCPNASMCTSYDSYDTVDALRKGNLAKRELPGQGKAKAWQSETIARAMVSNINCNVGARMYTRYPLVPYLAGS